MNAFFKDLFVDKVIAGSFLCALFFSTVTALAVGITFTKLPPFIPLFNQMPWGEARLGTREQIFFPFAIALFILGVNIILIKVLYGNMPLLSRILSITSLLIVFFAFLFTIRTIQLML